jgi:DNA processing protein
MASGTAAILGGGIDNIYPEENRELYEAIAEHGVLVAEPAIGTVPQARHFPRRNRIISGLSLGILVVEAAARSGSLITARLALEQGREVFAVPGSPLDPRCRGTNDLIRNGATLTETVEDILQQIPPPERRPPPPPAADLFAAASPRGEPPRPPAMVESRPLDGGESAEIVRAQILEQLGPTPVAVDELVRQCQLSPAAVVTILLELELAGRLDRHPGNQVSLLRG